MPAFVAGMTGWVAVAIYASALSRDVPIIQGENVAPSGWRNAA
jgi:hypothetical protein